MSTVRYSPIDTAMLWIEQQRFLEGHHHLINPRLYTAHEINMRNQALLRARWQDAIT